MTLEAELMKQRFANGYRLIDGVAMREENGEQFQIPHPVLKKHIKPGFYLELRIDSPRFSLHDQGALKCECPSCHGELTKPIIGHSQPASLLSVPDQNIPSRGWGEDFWAKVVRREGDYFLATVDNPLYESRLHGIRQGADIYFHSCHILAVHPSHRQEMVMTMDESDLKELVRWLGSL